MAEGYSETLRKTGGIDTVIVMRGASSNEVSSVLDRNSVTLVSQTEGIARDAKGEPIASPEVVVAANLPLKKGSPGEEGSVQLRGKKIRDVQAELSLHSGEILRLDKTRAVRVK